MTKLSDILAANGNGGNDIRDLWNSTDAADDFGPLPAGEYVARILSGELETSKTNRTPGYKLTFEVVEPAEFAKRRFWHDCWLTAAALPQTKRDLAKIGVQSLEQLERPLPKGILCRCKLALRRDDDGNERNRVRSFEVIGIEEPQSSPFAPSGTPNEYELDPTAEA